MIVLPQVQGILMGCVATFVLFITIIGPEYVLVIVGNSIILTYYFPAGITLHSSRGPNRRSQKRMKSRWMNFLAAPNTSMAMAQRKAASNS